MKRAIFVLALGFILLIPCVRSAEAAPITYAFSASPVVWDCDPNDPADPPCSGWSPEPGVAGTFTLDAGVLVSFDGHLPGAWASGSTLITTAFSGPASISYRLEELGWPVYEYSLTFADLPAGLSTSALVASDVTHFNPVLHGVFGSGEVRAEGAPVPEPASLLLLGTGLVGMRAWRTRRQ